MVWLQGWWRRRSRERFGAKRLSRGSDRGFDRLGEQFRGGVPDPSEPSPSTAHLGASVKPRRVASRNTRSRGRIVGTGVQRSGAFDCSRISDRSWVPHRLALLIPRFRSPHRDDLGLAGFAEPSGCLPARPATSAGRIGTPVPSIPRYMVGATSPILSTQARSSAMISAPSASRRVALG